MKSFRTIAGLNSNNRNADFSRLETASGRSIHAVDLHLNSAFQFRGDQLGQYITLARLGPDQL